MGLFGKLFGKKRKSRASSDPSRKQFRIFYRGLDGREHHYDVRSGSLADARSAAYTRHGHERFRVERIGSPARKRRVSSDPKQSATHGRLNRYALRFPSTREAENFHHGTDYIYRKEPVKLSDIGKTYDGKTVIVYAFSRYWNKQTMTKHARIYGGRVVGHGRDPEPRKAQRHRRPGAPTFTQQKHISRKIRLLRHEGKKPAQAAAIAYRMEGVSRPAAHRARTR